MRKKLASALADVKSDEVEDEYEEINVDAFTFSEVSTVISIKSSLFFLNNHTDVGNKKKRKALPRLELIHWISRNKEAFLINSCFKCICLGLTVSCSLRCSDTYSAINVTPTVEYHVF